MPPKPFQLAIVQMDVQLGDVEANALRIEHFAREAAAGGASLIVFPECSLSGYCFESLDEARDCAQRLSGSVATRLAGLAAELSVHMVYGFVEALDLEEDVPVEDGPVEDGPVEDGPAEDAVVKDRGETGVANSLALVGPQGLIGSYRKTHLPHLGVDHFATAGNRACDVHDTELCRIGMNICYDGAFPETARLLALAGADLIVLPTNWPPGAEEFALYGINTRALENKVYYASANRVGLERGFRFIGLSRIVDDHGRTLAEADGESECILRADIDPVEARQKRIDRVPQKHWIDRIGDRRPDLYGPLSQ